MVRGLALGLVALSALSACHVVEGRRSAEQKVAPPPSVASNALPTSSEVASAADAAPSHVVAGAELPSRPSRAAHVETDWCIDGFTALDEETCYVLPPLAEGKPRRLLLYLHGIVPPLPSSPQKTKVQLAVLHASTRAGAAALVPRGRRGIGPGDARDWWAWPTSPSAHAAHVASLVEHWRDAKRRLEAIAGAPFERTYLAGSSNGAYFVAALALRGDLDVRGLPVDGFAALSGGASGAVGAAALAGLAPHPFYVGFGTYDASTKGGARALAAVVDAARWPVRVAEHPFGHGAREEYLDEAFAFWDGAR